MSESLTKEYLDAEFDLLTARRQQSDLFWRLLLLELEQAKVLAPDVRAKLETLIA